MKKILTILATAMTAATLGAQTLNVTVGSVVYMFPASQTGDMTYNDGTTLNIMGKEFALSDISSMKVEDTEVTDNSIAVSYDGTSAVVRVAGNIARYVSPTVEGAHVGIEQSADVADEISYNLSGATSDGSFYMSGSYKATVELDNVSIVNSGSGNEGYAIWIANGKRINVSVSGENSLTDAAGGGQKACFFVKGHAEFKGDGSLTINGMSKHGFKCNEYMQLKKSFGGSIIVAQAASDGLHIGQYLDMRSGSISVRNAGDDCIQIESTDDETDENNGQCIISGGTIDCVATAAASKGLKSDSDMTISGGDITITTTGSAIWEEDTEDTSNSSTSGASAIKSGGNVVISDGVLTLTNTASGGKNISVDGNLEISGGSITCKNTGTLFYSNGTTTNTNYTGDTDRIDSRYTSSPKGIKVDGDVVISGGTIDINATGRNGEGIESKSTMTIDGGTLSISTYDDAINSTSDMRINGGEVTTVAANNDGIDSNGDLWITGGTVMAFGASDPECGLDADEQHKLYITGGDVLAVGGGNNTVSSTTGSQALLATTSSVSAGNQVSVKSGTTTLATFTVPSSYTASSSSGRGPGGSMGGRSSSVLISCAGLTSWTSYSVTINSTTTSVKAATTYSGR
ncbi:MAG: carbohydrate-binding domain-containing protein [Bacteroidales bacterium]|nr:carbohydrate-binding domain-containing protein [Bacteroidales bacterium]